jgi:CRP/FNR family transcriptional regulator
MLDGEAGLAARAADEGVTHRLVAGDQLELVDIGDAAALCIVAEGEVRILVHGADGRTLATDVAGAGDVFGESPMAGRSVRPIVTFVEAISDARIIALDPAGIDAVLRREPGLGHEIARALVDQSSRVRDLAARVTFLPVERRLDQLLLDLDARWGHPRLDGTRIINRVFTHEQIAELIGSTRKTVTRLLGVLREDGLVEVDQRRIVLLDSAGLARRLEP